jgi:hypothetical protein
MEIVFVWLGQFRTFHNVGLNFGSDYVYSFQYDRDSNCGTINRNVNDLYVEDLYFPLLNVTAIVGENASGKSSLIEALRLIIENDSRSYIQYFILFKEGDNLFYQYFFGYEEEDNQTPHSPRPISPEIVSNGDFALSPLGEKDFISIFFSQIIDLNIYPINHDSPLGIDISSNWLSYVDTKDEVAKEFGGLEYHKFCETFRQVDFAFNFSRGKDILEEVKITIPNYLAIYTTGLDYKFSNSGDGFHNTPYKFRPYINSLFAGIEEGFKASPDGKPYSFLYFLQDALQCLCKNMETSNRWLTENINMSIEVNDIATMEPFDAIELFLNSQSFFNGRYMVDLIHKVGDIINSDDTLSGSYSKTYWRTPLNENIVELLEVYKNFLGSLRMFNNQPDGFLSFDWHNMSTGEKAYFNLFSRFYHARNLIAKMQRNSPNNEDVAKALPSSLYVLIDEGEIGFHLQWQKEYVQKLVDSLPLLLSANDWKPSIQLIFTTHSPMSLSDITQDRIIYLQDGHEYNGNDMKSFGANITDLMAQSFFMHDGLVGSFAKSKINETIAWLNNEEDLTQVEYYRRFIAAIDEPIVQRKLIEMYNAKMGKDEAKQMQRQYIQKQINDFRTKYDEDI